MRPGPIPSPYPPEGEGKRPIGFAARRVERGCIGYNVAMTDRILLIEDDARLAEMVKNYLGGAGFHVTVAPKGATGIALEARETFDAVVLDLMLPDMDGLEICRRIRACAATPILMLTARGEPEDRIAGLEIGVDDYLPKPFEPKELLLRMENALRRWQPARRREISIGACVFDPVRGELRRDGEPVKLTARERDMLRLFARTPGRAITRTDLSDVGGASARSVDVQVNRLRRKIEPDPRHPIYLQTIRGEGYVLMGE
jgi:two-component system phosphate regulon response regulator OmpR